MKKGCREDILILCPKKTQRMFTMGEARGGDFALNDIPHPCCGLNLGANILKFFLSNLLVDTTDYSFLKK